MLSRTGRPFFFRAEGARDLLLDLDHADVLLGPVVRVGYIEVVHEPQHTVAMLVEVLDEVSNLALLDPTTGLPCYGIGQRVFCKAILDDGVVDAAQEP